MGRVVSMWWGREFGLGMLLMSPGEIVNDVVGRTEVRRGLKPALHWVARLVGWRGASGLVFLACAGGSRGGRPGGRRVTE